SAHCGEAAVHVVGERNCPAGPVRDAREPARGVVAESRRVAMTIDQAHEPSQAVILEAIAVPGREAIAARDRDDAAALEPRRTGPARAVRGVDVAASVAPARGDRS